jgi:hypothetical protein
MPPWVVAEAPDKGREATATLAPPSTRLSAGGNGGSSLAQDPIHQHVKVAERLGNGSLR